VRRVFSWRTSIVIWDSGEHSQYLLFLMSAFAPDADFGINIKPEIAGTGFSADILSIADLTVPPSFSYWYH